MNFSSEDERVRLYQGTDNEIVLNFLRVFVVEISGIVVDCFRVGSAFT
jgi:hypothetical protein